MPTVHRFGPYRFYFYSQENRATLRGAAHPRRVGRRCAVFWFAPVSLRDNQGYTPREVERIRRIVTANRELLLRSLE